MTEYTLASYNFPNLSVNIYFDDIELELTAVEVNNNTNKYIYTEANKLNPPAKTFNHTFAPGDNIRFDIPKGFKLEIEVNPEGGYNILTPLTTGMWEVEL